VKFYGAGHGAGIKPIVGADFNVHNELLGDELTHLTVLAANNTKYVAPYVNRVDAQGGDGIRMVQELQTLLEHHAPDSMVLAAS
ncbi:hypothetical protein MJN69_29850, partial [Salmonella enterica subsp. enterica serovar Kentucky]|nr:hypothetical protein [Salmonella enterica subsp. enterica serovar Kentucky]